MILIAAVVAALVGIAALIRDVLRERPLLTISFVAYIEAD